MKDYQATVATIAGVFDSIRIDADEDKEAVEIALKWASGRSGYYTLQLKDIGGSEPRYLVCKDYRDIRR